MTNLYPIEGTKNLDKEQLIGAYLDIEFWPNFQQTIDEFKKKLMNISNEKGSFKILRLGHSEMTAFYIALNKNKKVGNFKGRQSKYNTIPDDTIMKMFESILTTDYVSTQIGYDFFNWLNIILTFVECYKKLKNTPNFILNNEIKNEIYNYPIITKNANEIMDIPLDIIYALIANKWIFKTFKNKIGLIGATEKLNAIKELMKYKEYQEYLGTDYFLEYIDIPQRGALDDNNLEDNIMNKINNSECKFYLIGAGVSKLKFFHLLKNGIYIDVGHGICMIAGYGDNTRPYCGNWINYKIKNKKYKIDDLGSHGTSIFYIE